MSNKNLDHKQLLVAKCYDLALRELPHVKRFSETYHTDEDLTVDDHAMRYLDKIIKAADVWAGKEAEAKSAKDSYERNR